jgi:hypothetical protein
MKIATTVLQTLVRLSGLTLIVLGMLFWTGHALTLIPVHMLVGFVLVLSLWALAVLAARAGVHPGLVILAMLWGGLVPVLGLTQDRLLLGDAHWMIQVLHLLVGLGAIGQAEGLAARIRGRQPFRARAEGRRRPATGNGALTGNAGREELP